MNVTKWTWASQIYMVFTSYKYLRGGNERCQESKEFDCSPPSFLSSSQDHMCMSSNLACDGLPNCGQVSWLAASEIYVQHILVYLIVFLS